MYIVNYNKIARDKILNVMSCVRTFIHFALSFLTLYTVIIMQAGKKVIITPRNNNKLVLVHSLHLVIFIHAVR